MDVAGLLKLAELRRVEVTLGDGASRQWVREPTLAEHLKHREMQRLVAGDPTRNTEASAYLLAACVVTEEGAPALSLEDARKLAGGSRLVALPLLVAILELGEPPKPPKKANEPPEAVEKKAA